MRDAIEVSFILNETEIRLVYTYLMCDVPPTPPRLNLNNHAIHIPAPAHPDRWLCAG